MDGGKSAAKRKQKLVERRDGFLPADESVDYPSCLCGSRVSLVLTIISILFNLHSNNVGGGAEDVSSGLSGWLIRRIDWNVLDPGRFECF